jgi:hypothetical protein
LFEYDDWSMRISRGWVRSTRSIIGGTSPALALVPLHVRPFIEDYVKNNLFPPKRTTPLWRAPLIERAARIMHQYRKQEGLSVEAAAARVLKEYSSTFAGYKLSTLINQYTGRSTSGRRWKKRRPSP